MLCFRSTWLQAGADLKHFPSQIYEERHGLSLWLVRSIFLYISFEKGLFGDWGWFGPFSSTNPLRKARSEAGAGLKHFPLQILWEKLIWRLDLVWSTFPFKKSSLGGWSWFETFSFTNHMRKAHLEARPGLKHLPLLILYENLVWRQKLVWSTFLYKSFKKKHICRLELVWSTLLSKSWRKSLFGGWGWFGTFSFTNP